MLMFLGYNIPVSRGIPKGMRVIAPTQLNIRCLTASFHMERYRAQPIGHGGTGENMNIGAIPVSFVNPKRKFRI